MGMPSLKELYRTGRGPSSSHTIAPSRAVQKFSGKNPAAASFRITLFGSLAATGRGHLTDRAIADALAPRRAEIVWRANEDLPLHPNGMRIDALDSQGAVLDTEEEYSIGGGALLHDRPEEAAYRFSSMSAALEELQAGGETLWEYVQEAEGSGLWEFLRQVWEAMEAAVQRGLGEQGKLPGGLGLGRKAVSFFRKSSTLDPSFRAEALLAAYAYAVAEENACGGVVVTAPTCGSAGVLPSVLLFLKNSLPCRELDILRALATAGLIGNFVKLNGSISGAEVGCQGEVGTACAMAAGAAAQLFGGTPRQIEYAAEMGLEHHLGLTCDPVRGLVQIPCIERNAHAALRAMSSARFAILSDGSHRISFDDAVSVLLETGRSLSRLYRETAGGGLARVYEERFKQRGR